MPKCLRLGGINIAIAQLTYNKDEKNEAEKNKEKDKVETRVIKPESDY